MYYKKLALLGLAIFSLSGCSDDSADSGENTKNKTPGLSEGQALFAKNCAGCHGRGGKGTDQGPPFIHKIYEPNHHGDASFYRAAEKGVRAHHWKFGDMPPVKDVSRSELTKIISYIRHIQGKAGIF